MASKGYKFLNRHSSPHIIYRSISSTTCVPTKKRWLIMNNSILVDLNLTDFFNFVINVPTDLEIANQTTLSLEQVIERI